MRRIVILITVALISSTAYAQYEEVADDPSPFSDAALLSEQEWIQPGAPFSLGVHLMMDDGWHNYWINPGDSGEPTDIFWDLPEGFVAGPIQWPYPKKIDAGPLRSYGYAGDVLLITEITPPANIALQDSVVISATANWLVCADVCLLAEESVAITLPVGMGEAPPSRSFDDFAQVRTRLPATLPDWDVRAFSYSQSFGLQVTPPKGSSINLEGGYFFPSDPLLLEHAVDQPVSHDGDVFVIALQQSGYASEIPSRMFGVLVAPEGDFFDTDQAIRALAIDVPIEEAATEVSSSSTPLLLLLLFALTGGLLLNLMPCVFPIISIKVLGFVQHGNMQPTAVRRHGLTFATGVLISFWILAGLLLALRAAGNQIGWGFQLQSPFFVAGMAMLFFAVGLSLLDVFGVGTFSNRWTQKVLARDGYQRSFWDGALATLVATPCTAPLMGAALGAAVVLPTVQALLIFSFLGLGMALPYVILSMTPGLIKKMPKPGPWMKTMKHILAFPMIATTIWLVWVFGQQVGTNGLALLLVGLLLMSIALWTLGQWPSIQITMRTRMITRTVAVLFGALSLITVYQGAQATATSASTTSADSSSWAPFSTSEIESLRAEGRTVFVDFTAAWCLTCQVNKRTTLSSDIVQEAFSEKDVHLMRADWTSRDAEITRALESHGRSGVPLYVLYPGSGDPPVLLPEVLTESIVLDALAELPDRIAGTTVD